MSTYVMSDLHGEYQKFLAMLDKIDFSEEDLLYILGDVIDRGEEPIPLLIDLSQRDNVIPLIGNHELMLLDVMAELMVEIREDNYSTHITPDMLHKLFVWQENGGDVTLKQFTALPNDDRLALLSYLEDFLPYETVEVNGRTFVLTHSGGVTTDKPLSEHSLRELTFARLDYDRTVYEDPSVYLVSGHTPTPLISGKPEIYHGNRHLNIDCGAVFGGRLACLRLDDMTEFYV
ncbi:MAG: metallophosphoesterase [Clostridia bacterium]|nr:metallophosphoesterase [Clostridia bacterium]